MIDIIKEKRDELARLIADNEAKKIECFSQIKECEENIEKAKTKIDAYDEVIKDLEVVPVADETPVAEPAKASEEPTEHIIRISQSGF